MIRGGVRGSLQLSLFIRRVNLHQLKLKHHVQLLRGRKNIGGYFVLGERKRRFADSHEIAARKNFVVHIFYVLVHSRPDTQ